MLNYNFTYARLKMDKRFFFVPFVHFMRKLCRRMTNLHELNSRDFFFVNFSTNLSHLRFSSFLSREKFRRSKKGRIFISFFLPNMERWSTHDVYRWNADVVSEDKRGNLRLSFYLRRFKELCQRRLYTKWPDVWSHKLRQRPLNVWLAKY